MPASIGVNLRVTGHCRQGGRKYMEDFFSVAYQQTEDERDLEYAFFGIYDGHGGAEAASFAKERLMETIVRHKSFWSDSDEEVLRAIKLGYIATHYAMWKEQEKWPKTASGLPSTAGTTASIAFIRRGKIYIGHVGDSGIVLGYQEPGCAEWKAKPLTRDHKPECEHEMSRIEQCGGKVVSKSGVPRVVWNRPRIGHKGPVRRSTPIDEIPFLAVARSLGDLWSYNSELDQFVVSPDPDCSVIPIDTTTFRCLIFGTDGLYNMLSPQMAVHIVQQAERHNEEAALSDAPNKVWVNPSKCLVERALELWSTTKMRADNTSVVTLMLDPPGPPRAQVLRNRKKNYPDSGLQIVTRYQDETPDHKKSPADCNGFVPESSQVNQIPAKEKAVDLPQTTRSELDTSFVLKPRESLSYNPKCSTEDATSPRSGSRKSYVESSESASKFVSKNYEIECDSGVSVSTTTSLSEVTTSLVTTCDKSEENIQINEISSSSNDTYDLENVKTRAKRGEKRKTGQSTKAKCKEFKHNLRERKVTSSNTVEVHSTNVVRSKIVLRNSNSRAIDLKKEPKVQKLQQKIAGKLFQRKVKQSVERVERKKIRPSRNGGTQDKSHVSKVAKGTRTRRDVASRDVQTFTILRKLRKHVKNK